MSRKLWVSQLRLLQRLMCNLKHPSLVSTCPPASPTLSSSTTMFTNRSSMTISTGTNVFTTANPVLRTSITSVAAPTETEGEAVASSSVSFSRLKTIVIGGSVGVGLVVVVVLTVACFVVRPLRQRSHHSESSSLFPVHRPDSRSTFLRGSRSQPSSVQSGIDLEAGAQEALDVLDLARPSIQPFLRAGGSALNVTVVPPKQGRVESCTASVVDPEYML
ncbi:hypothetical protein MVEN_01485600 [Mycena venus]|uniref:Uncharacterized protein n=1 Tax=Mycena venus TaxID=2733690 RepID=A0A8H6XTM6_9AGAR|nr:hypothetical protein MVEN_01485600 [Mycena venus]